MIFEYIWIYLIRRVDVSSWLWCMDIFACNGFINPRIYNRTWHLGMGQVIHSVPQKGESLNPAVFLWPSLTHTFMLLWYDPMTFLLSQFGSFTFCETARTPAKAGASVPSRSRWFGWHPRIFLVTRCFFPAFQAICCGGQPFLSCVCCAGTIWHCQTKHPLSSTPGYANRFINRRQGHPNLTWQA